MYKNRVKKYTYFMKLPLFYFFSMLREFQKACSDNSVLFPVKTIQKVCTSKYIDSMRVFPMIDGQAGQVRS